MLCRHRLHIACAITSNQRHFVDKSQIIVNVLANRRICHYFKNFSASLATFEINLPLHLIRLVSLHHINSNWERNAILDATTSTLFSFSLQIQLKVNLKKRTLDGRRESNLEAKITQTHTMCNTNRKSGNYTYRLCRCRWQTARRCAKKVWKKKSHKNWCLVTVTLTFKSLSSCARSLRVFPCERVFSFAFVFFLAWFASHIRCWCYYFRCVCCSAYTPSPITSDQYVRTMDHKIQSHILQFSFVLSICDR